MASRTVIPQMIGRNRTQTLVTYEALRPIVRISWNANSLSHSSAYRGAFRARADVIHLKNGRTIWADEVRQDKNKDRVEYDVAKIPTPFPNLPSTGSTRVASLRRASVPRHLRFQSSRRALPHSPSKATWPRRSFTVARSIPTRSEPLAKPEIPNSRQRDISSRASSSRITETIPRPGITTRTRCTFSPTAQPC